MVSQSPSKHINNSSVIFVRKLPRATELNKWTKLKILAHWSHSRISIRQLNVSIIFFRWWQLSNNLIFDRGSSCFFASRRSCLVLPRATFFWKEKKWRFLFSSWKSWVAPKPILRRKVHWILAILLKVTPHKRNFKLSLLLMLCVRKLRFFQ